VLLHRGEADRIQPAELADGAFTVKSLRDDVAPCRIAEREKQPVGLSLALKSVYNQKWCLKNRTSTPSTTPTSART
jgi:hypothetical protein